MTENTTSRTSFIVSLILVGIISRFIPHPPNFTAVAAAGLFAGAQMGNKKLAVLVPLVILFISDLFIGFHSSMLAVYVSMALVVGIGVLAGKNKTVLNIAGGAVAASIVFFLITNAAVWIGSPMYSQNMGGLSASYIAAIPFFWNSIAADLFYTGLFFGLHYLAITRFPQLAK